MILPVIGPPLKSSVIVMEPETPPYAVPVADVMTIGRLGYGHEGEPIRLRDGLASAGRHATLRRTDEGLVVQDMGSTNTTLLNGSRTRNAQLLHVGDEVQAGHTMLRFEHTLDHDPWPAGEARSLFSAILAAPSDDRPRRVLADWLLERGDPRGEFIVCQLATSPTERARAKKLLTQHALEWIGPLPFPVEQWTFAGGFLATVRVRDVAAAQVLRNHHPLTAIEPLMPAEPRRFDR